MKKVKFLFIFFNDIIISATPAPKNGREAVVDCTYSHLAYGFQNYKLACI